MTKAEEKALEAYPIDICGYECGCEIGDSPEPLDYNEERRRCYQEGYEQAEVDIKGSLLEWLKYVKNLWSQTSASLAAMQTLEMVINKVKED